MYANDLGIDPCPPCTLKYGLKDVNSVKDCCYNSCARLMGGSNTDPSAILNSPCGQRCKACAKMLLTANDKSICAYKLFPPIFFLQPHFFQESYKELVDSNFQGDKVQQAHGMCVDKCKKNSANYSSDKCISDCGIDAQAVGANPTAFLPEAEKRAGILGKDGVVLPMSPARRYKGVLIQENFVPVSKDNGFLILFLIMVSFLTVWIFWNKK